MVSTAGLGTAGRVGVALLALVAASPTAFAAPDSGDDTDGRIEALVASPAAGASFAVGELVSFADGSTTAGSPRCHIVAWTWHFGDGATATDQHPAHAFAAAGTMSVSLDIEADGCGEGNRFDSTSLALAVVAPDSTPPTLDLPASLSVEATSADGAVATFDAAATDDVDGPVAIACSPPSGSTFALGVAPVSCSATDAAGNQASGTFDVTVADTTPPVLTLPEDIEASAVDAAGATVLYDASASDAVDSALVATCSPASGFTFPLGTTEVACSATDRSGNSVSGAFVVVVSDGDAPVLVVPADVTLEAVSRDGTPHDFAATATDAVDAAPTIACDPSSGATFGLGATEVRCAAQDAAGNEASATFTVTVVDTTAPSLATPDVVLETGDLGGAIGEFAPVAADVADATPVVLCAPASGSRFALGTTRVECTATDASGNVGSSSFTVRVLLRETVTPNGGTGAGTVLVVPAAATAPVTEGAAFAILANLPPLAGADTIRLEAPSFDGSMLEALDIGFDADAAAHTIDVLVEQFDGTTDLEEVSDGGGVVVGLDTAAFLQVRLVVDGAVQRDTSSLVSGATFRIVVPRAFFDSHAELRVVRFSYDAARDEVVRTELSGADVAVVSVGDEQVVLEVRTPGFSVFAVVGVARSGGGGVPVDEWYGASTTAIAAPTEDASDDSPEPPPAADAPVFELVIVDTTTQAGPAPPQAPPEPPSVRGVAMLLAFAVGVLAASMLLFRRLPPGGKGPNPPADP